MNKKSALGSALLISATLSFAAGFDSGSTGADGAFAPSTNTVVTLPANGVLNYTSVTIPTGVTVRFKRNAANTPVVMLATGPVKIAGTIDISGAPGTTATTPVILGVTNKGGAGGPGGFDGGMGGAVELNRNGGSGYGPGGGGGGQPSNPTYGWGCGASFVYVGDCNGGANSPAYGANAMFPIIGGSGGGGGSGGIDPVTSYSGSGGGGGGGALLIVSSQSVDLTGQIKASGGASGAYTDGKENAPGGHGSGGMVKVLAPAYSGSGTIDVNSGAAGINTGRKGSVGRTVIEVVANGGSFNPAMLPTLSITDIGGVAVPAAPSGNGDVTLPLSLGNPVQVTVSAGGISLGTVVRLSLNNNNGAVAAVNTGGLTGTVQASTASASMSIPSGSTTLSATATYTLTLAQGEALKVYADGERVEKISLAAALGDEMKVTLITASGKEFVVPAAVLATLQAEMG